MRGNMIKLFSMLKKDYKNFNFNELGAELLEKNKALETVHKSGELAEKLFKEKEAEAARKEKLLEEKSDLLYRIEYTLKNQELELTKRLSELRERQALERLKEDEISAQKKLSEKKWGRAQKNKSGIRD